MTTFTHLQLEAIAGALGETPGGLTEEEISALLETASIPVPDAEPGADSGSGAGATMRQRLVHAFADVQTTRNDRTHILAFICTVLKPERFADAPERFELMRFNVNRALALAGLTVSEEGKLEAMRAAAARLSEASKRARELRADLTYRGVHPEVLRHCQQELLVDSYLPVVLDAMRGVVDKIRLRTGLRDDGVGLIDHALGGDLPLLTINGFASDSQSAEQKGFANLLRGVLGMFGDPAAPAAGQHWHMTKDDAEDLLGVISLIHRRLDAAAVPRRM